jgi:hypothetical protein
MVLLIQILIVNLFVILLLWIQFAIPFAIHLVFSFVRMMLILGTSDGVDV